MDFQTTLKMLPSVLTLAATIAAAAPQIDFWAVEAISPKRRLPTAAPEDGVKGGELRVIAAQGEYEAASFVLSSNEDIADATLSLGDFVRVGGAKIPASEADVKIVKCWYQSGTAWHGFHSDMTRRILTPELLLHDETLVKVDDATGDDFVRCDYADGSRGYYWTTYLPVDCKYQGGYYGFRNAWVHDAETLQPFALEKNRFKQFWITLHVPENTPEGLYRGTATVNAGGAKTQIPVVVKVLPFALPEPAVFRDPNRKFYASMYVGEGGVDCGEKTAANLARHNLLNPFLGSPADDAKAKALYDRLEKYGFGTDMLFSHLPGSHYTMSAQPSETDASFDEFNNFLADLSNAVRRVRERYGEKAIPFSYGIDEGNAAKVRAQRAAWKAVQALGGRTIVATKMRDFILFNLDAANIPEVPSPMRREWNDKLHASNPDMLVGWYADPHSGPENPDMARRQYGWMTWRNNYDMVCQYTMFVRGWAEFNRPYENDLRSLSFAYAQDGDLIDTLQWEGFREAIDDIRYGTLLSRLADEARVSKDVDVMYAGRAAKTWLAQVPYQESSLKTLRLEMIGKITNLRVLLKKEGR